jgi:hypothetical protein
VGQLPATQKPAPSQSVQYVGDIAGQPASSIDSVTVPSTAASIAWGAPRKPPSLEHSSSGQERPQDPGPPQPAQYICPAGQPELLGSADEVPHPTSGRRPAMTRTRPLRPDRADRTLHPIRESSPADRDNATSARWDRPFPREGDLALSARSATPPPDDGTTWHDDGCTPSKGRLAAALLSPFLRGSR